MSYILDALRKADAERERRGVPSLSAHNATADGDEASRGGAARGLAAGALVLLALGALWWWWSGRAAAPVAAAAPPAAAVTVPPPSPPTIAAAPPVSPPTPAPAPLPQVIVPPAPPAVALPAAAAPPPIASPAVPPTPATTGDRVPPLAELGVELRRQLPPLNVSGAVYAPQASGRMLFLNGQVLREGDAVAEGLVVERIGAKASVLSLRGTKFELKH